ncbi:MAG: PAS domain S-box protein, partial [Desulfobacterales bacterium]
MAEKPTYEELEQRIKELGKRVLKRKLVEEALRTSEKRYKDLSDHMNDGVAIYRAENDGEDFVFIDFNKSAERIDNVKRNDLIGKSVLKIFPGVKDFGLFDVFKRVWKTGKSEKYAIVLYEDERISGWRDNFVYKVPSGEIVAIYRDETEKKLAEEALKESEARFRAIFEHMEAASCLDEIVYDGGKAVDYRILDVNPSYEKILGIKKEKVIGSLASQVYGTGEAPFLDIYSKVAETGQPASFEAYLALVDKYLQVTSSSPEKGKFSNIFSDITERKLNEEERDKLQSQLSNAIEMAHLGHWEYDVANDLFTFNDHFYKIFRTTAKQIGGYTMSSAEYARRFLHPDDMHLVVEETRKAVEATDPHFSRQLEHRMLYADGTVGHITVRFFIVKDAHGRTVKTYGVNQDITERKQAEEALKISRENLLEESNQRKILSKRLIDLLEKDRHDIAMELHDNIGQILTSLKINLEVIDDKLKPVDT